MSQANFNILIIMIIRRVKYISARDRNYIFNYPVVRFYSNFLPIYKHHALLTDYREIFDHFNLICSVVKHKLV